MKLMMWIVIAMATFAFVMAGISHYKPSADSLLTELLVDMDRMRLAVREGYKEEAVMKIGNRLYRLEKRALEAAEKKGYIVIFTDQFMMSYQSRYNSVRSELRKRRASEPSFAESVYIPYFSNSP